MTDVAIKLNIPDAFTPELFVIRSKWWAARDNFHNCDFGSKEWTRNEERVAALEAELIAATNLALEQAAA